MHKIIIKRLWSPFFIFGVFLGITFFSRDLILQFGAEAISQTQKVLSYVIQIGIWLSAAHFLNRLFVVFFWDGFVQRTLGTPVPRLLRDLLTLVIYLIAVTGIIGLVFQKDVTAFWAASGALGIVLGLALQNMILDIFTGLAVNIDRPFKIGDWIKVHGSDPVVGKIIEVNWRTTRLESEINNEIILPNRVLGTAVVTNYYAPTQASRHETMFCIDFSLPTERVRRILLAGVKAAMGKRKELLEDPSPSVIVNMINPTGIEYKVRYFMTPWSSMAPGMARNIVTSSILEHLKLAGIEPAYPKQDIFYAENPQEIIDARSLDERSKMLSKLVLFEQLEEHEIKDLAADMNLRDFSSKEKLIAQGDAGESMFILSEGLLEVFINTNGADQEIRVGQISPGEFFGEMSLLTGEPRTATIVAATDVVAHEITKDNMTKILTQRPEIAEVISKVVAHRRVLNSQALADASPEERIEEAESLARQIMGKMKTFFKGVFEKKAAAGKPA